jgi:hypothetical protein
MHLELITTLDAKARLGVTPLPDEHRAGYRRLIAAHAETVKDILTAAGKKNRGEMHSVVHKAQQGFKEKIRAWEEKVIGDYPMMWGVFAGYERPMANRLTDFMEAGYQWGGVPGWGYPGAWIEVLDGIRYVAVTDGLPMSWHSSLEVVLVPIDSWRPFHTGYGMSLVKVYAGAEDGDYHLSVTNAAKQYQVSKKTLVQRGEGERAKRRVELLRSLIPGLVESAPEVNLRHGEAVDLFAAA